MTDIAAHTVVTTRENGEVHVQSFGPGHVVAGTERVIEVPAGSVVVIRHLAPSEEAPPVRPDA